MVKKTAQTLQNHYFKCEINTGHWRNKPVFGLVDRILSLRKTLIVHLQEPWPQIARRTMQLSLKQQHCSYHSNVLIFIFHYLFFCGMVSLLVHIFGVWIYMCYKFQCLLYCKIKTVVLVCFHYFFQYFFDAPE